MKSPPQPYNDTCTQSTTGKDGAGMIRKYIRYNKAEVYAVYYRAAKTIYYNVNFRGRVKLIIIV